MQKTLEDDTPFRFIGMWRLSRLRKRLIRIENKLNQLRSDHKRREAYAKTVIRTASNDSKATGNLPDQLRSIAQDWRDNEEQLTRMKEHIERQRDHLNWMEQWLAYQEQRFSRYLPRKLPIPGKNNAT